jgi:hypothetical protein
LFSTRNRHQIKIPDQKSSQPIVASNIIMINNNHNTESPTMANNTKTTTQTHHGQFNTKLNKMPFIENWISHPKKQYDMQQNKSDTSSTRCTTPELNSSSSSAPSIFSTNSDSTSVGTSSKAHNAILAELQRLRTKINQQYHVLRTTSHGVSTTIYRPKQQDANDNINVGTETKKHFNGAPRSILKVGRAIKQHLTIHHRHTENSISFEDETQSDVPFALPNFIQTKNYSRGRATINNISNNNGTFKGTFTPVGNTVNKHFVDGYYSHHQKQEATVGEFTPVSDSINPHYIDGEYINCSEKHHDQDRKIPT